MPHSYSIRGSASARVVMRRRKTLQLHAIVKYNASYVTLCKQHKCRVTTTATLLKKFVIVAASICRILVLPYSTIVLVLLHDVRSIFCHLITDISVNFLTNKFAAVIWNMTLSLLVVSIVLHNFIVITSTWLSLPFIITNNADRTRFTIK